jgi:hypothetical protein
MESSLEALTPLCPKRRRDVGFKILDFHGGDYEELRLLGCYAVWLL